MKREPMTPSMKSETTMESQVPLTELLRSVPKTARDWFQEAGIIGSRHIPFGLYCHQAADRMDNLESQLSDALKALEDCHSLLGDVVCTVPDGTFVYEKAHEMMNRISPLIFPAVHAAFKKDQARELLRRGV